MESIIAATLADGMQRGEFRPVDAYGAAGCIHMAMMQYLHPALITEPCAFDQPTPDVMVDFCLRTLKL